MCAKQSNDTSENKIVKDMSDELLQQVIEAALFVADNPLSIINLQDQLLVEYKVPKKRIMQVIDNLKNHYAQRGITLVQIASGYRFQTANHLSDELSPLFKERAPRYSRALLETLAIIAYKQPVTRGEIEQIRGVSVSSYIMKTLQDRNWVEVVGHKEVPGRPALLATTASFLDYFSLKTLDELPPLINLPNLELT